MPTIDTWASPLARTRTRTNELINQIFIKTLTGRKQAFNFEPENQVLAVKQALQEKEGIQVDQIRLIFSGKQLSDDRTLESYAINAGATIHMVLQLRGGADLVGN
jgi:ubiquitin-like protein Nedd8